MARTDSLGNFLADIAAVIKEKKGTTGPISAKDFDTEIETVVELAKEDYNTLTAGIVHLSTKYTDWENEIEKEENNIVVVPAGIGAEKEYALLDSSYSFTDIKINYEVNIPKCTIDNTCSFVSDGTAAVIIETTAAGGLSIKISDNTGKDTYPTADYIYNYTWDDASQLYRVTTRRNLYWMPSGGSASSNSAIEGPDSDILSMVLTKEVSCSTLEQWKSEYGEIAKVFVYPIIPEETYICKDEEWINIKNTISADKYVDGDEVYY